MARNQQFREEPITASDISEYLTTTDDFQLEVDVFRMCLAKRLDAEHAGSYHDPVTGKRRQFDVRAKYTEGSRIFKMAIECKNLKSNGPLVVSCLPRTSREACHEIYVSSSLGNLGAQTRRDIFSSEQPVGKSTAQIRRRSDKSFDDRDSETFVIWDQTIASCYDLLSESMTDYMKVKRTSAMIVIQPILVVADETLWVVDYDNKGKLLGNPKLVPECTYYLDTLVSTTYGRNKIAMSYNISHLLIFTKTGFSSFLNSLTNGGMCFERWLGEESPIQ